MDILFKSLASAVITGLILLIANYSGPKLAGAIGGIPIIFAITYVLIMMDNKNSAHKFLSGGIYGTIATMLFVLVLLYLNYKFPNAHWTNFVVAYVMCFLFALGSSSFSSK